MAKQKKNIADSSEQTLNYRRMVNATLAAMLSKFKENNKVWQDSEREDPSQTLLYKRAEALTCFVLPLQINNKIEKDDINEGTKWFFSELVALFDLIEKDGFDPNPYTYLKSEKIDFVDCASQVLELLILVKKHLSYTPGYKTCSGIIEKTAKRAMNFLLKCAINEKDKRTAWAANESYKFKMQIFLNIYFTSYALKSLSLLLTENPWNFVDEERKRIVEVIQGGCLWINDRFEKETGILYFDKQRAGSTYYDFAFVILALLSAYEYVSEELKIRNNDLCSGFIQRLETDLVESGFMYILIPKADTPLYYDNRLSIGVIASALCRLASLAILPDNLEEELFSKLGVFRSTLLRKRDSSTELWDEDAYLVSSTLWGIVGLLYIDLFGRVSTYTIDESELYKVLKKSLNDPKVIKTLLGVFQQELIQKKTGENE